MALRSRLFRVHALCLQKRLCLSQLLGLHPNKKISTVRAARRREKGEPYMALKASTQKCTHITSLHSSSARARHQLRVKLLKGPNNSPKPEEHSGFIFIYIYFLHLLKFSQILQTTLFFQGMPLSSSNSSLDINTLFPRFCVTETKDLVLQVCLLKRVRIVR